MYINNFNNWYSLQKNLFEYGIENPTIDSKLIRFKIDDYYIDLSINNEFRIKPLRFFRESYIDFSSFDNGRFLFFNIWHDDVNKSKFTNLIFDLYNNPANSYNLFNGFQINKNTIIINDNEIDELIKPLIGNNGILFYLSNEDNNNLNFLLKWLSNILKAKKTGVILVFNDKNGNYNNFYNLFINWFVDKIIGNDYYLKCNSIYDFLNKSHENLLNKLIVNINDDIYSSSKESSWYKFKNYFSLNQLDIKNKSINIENKLNFISYCNNKNKKDKNIFNLEISNQLNNIEYWNNILSDIKIQNAFFLYLSKTVIPYSSETEFINNIPGKNKNKTNIITNLNLLHINLPQKINTRILLERFFIYLYNEKIITQSQNYFTKNLFEIYKSWCDNNNYYYDFSLNGFGQILSNSSKINLKFLNKISSHHVRGYKLDFEIFKLWHDNYNNI